MTDGVRQEYIKSDKSPLAVLTRDKHPYQGYKDYDLVGHIVRDFPIIGGQRVWEPYKIWEKMDFDSSSHLILPTKSIDYVIEELKKGQEMPFLLADGYFPTSGCGGRISCGKVPRLIIVPGKYSAEEIDSESCERAGYDAGMEHRATGKLKFDKSGLRVYDFTSGFLKKLEDYEDTIAAIAESYLAPEGEHILFSAKLEEAK